LCPHRFRSAAIQGFETSEITWTPLYFGDKFGKNQEIYRHLKYYLVNFGDMAPVACSKGYCVEISPLFPWELKG
jgi:hypothetical protein